MLTDLKYDKNILIITILVVVYGLWFSFYTVMKHYSFYSYAFDLGIFDQLFWGMINHGNMVTTIERVPPVDHLAVHFSPLLYLLAPFYYLHSAAPTLLVLQSFMIGAAALPIYWLARHKTQNPTLSLVIGISYLLYPAVHYLNERDFHEVALTIPLLLCSLYYLEIEDYKAFAVFLLLAFLTKEEVALSGVGIGLYALWAKNQRQLGWWVIVGSLIYFFAVTKIFMPMIGYPYHYDFSSRYLGLIPPGKGYESILMSVIKDPIGILKYIFLDSTKLLYLFTLLLPVAFFPLCNRLKALVIIFPSLLINLLSSQLEQYQINTQYSAIVTVFIYFLTVLGASNVINVWRSCLVGIVGVGGEDAARKRNKIKAVVVLAVVTLILVVYGLSKYVDPEQTNLLTICLYFLVICGAYNIGCFVVLLDKTITGDAEVVYKKATTMVATVIMVSSLFAMIFIYGMHFVKVYGLVFLDTPHKRLLHQLIDRIPPQASVSARYSIVPHLSGRDKAFYLREVAPDTEYLLYDVTVPFFDSGDKIVLQVTRRWCERLKLRNVPLPYSCTYTPQGEVRREIAMILDLMQQKKYGVIEYQDRCLLLKKGYDAARNLEVIQKVQRYLDSQRAQH